MDFKAPSQLVTHLNDCKVKAHCKLRCAKCDVMFSTKEVDKHDHVDTGVRDHDGLLKLLVSTASSMTSPASESKQPDLNRLSQKRHYNSEEKITVSKLIKTSPDR